MRDVGAEAANQRDAVRIGRHRQHLCADSLGELDGDVADAAAGAEDHQLLARLEVERVVEPAKRRDAVRAQRAGFSGVDPRGDRRHIVGGNGDVLRVEPALECIGVDAVSGLEALDGAADGDDGASAVIADDPRELPFRPHLELSRAQLRIPDSDPGRVEADEHLPGLGPRYRQ